MAVFVLLVEKPHRQLGEAEISFSGDDVGPRRAGPGFALAYPIQGGPGLAETLLENADGSSGFALWSTMSQGWWLSSAKTTGQFSKWPLLLTLKSNLGG